MTLVLSLMFAVIGSVVMGMALRAIFKKIKPANVSEYRACVGGWWEEELNQCSTGLLMVPQQPVNTYTNLLYLAGGLFLVFQFNTLSSFVFSLTLLYLCVGSALYHAFSTRWAGRLDVSAIYAVFSALTIYSGSRLVNLSDSMVALIMFVIAVLAAYLLTSMNYFRRNMAMKIAVFLVLTYSLTIWNMVRSNNFQLKVHLIVSFILFVIAFIIWNLDKRRSFLFKRWGHGFWHMFTAIAISILYYTLYMLP